jgi:acetyl/propionyl-CoA carboxylase alpha subunit
MLKIHVSGSPFQESSEVSLEDKTFEISNKKGKWFVGDEQFDGDIAETGRNNKSYNVEVLEVNSEGKSIHLLINGQHCYTKTKDQLDLILEGMGLQNSTVQKLNNIKAPMPGLIQSVAVSEGDVISKGDTLLVLVAMKMENVIRSSGNGIVKTLKVASGETVEKNQVLLEFQ